MFVWYNFLPLRGAPSFVGHLFLAEELFGIEDASGADDGLHAKKNARWNVVGEELLAVMKNGVARVTAAVVAEDVRIAVFMA